MFKIYQVYLYSLEYIWQWKGGFFLEERIYYLVRGVIYIIYSIKMFSFGEGKVVYYR